jgi:hypothetical protein
MKSDFKKESGKGLVSLATTEVVRDVAKDVAVEGMKQQWGSDSSA